MNLDEPCFEHSTSVKTASGRWPMSWSAVFRRGFFDAAVAAVRREGLLSDEHFTMDSTLI